MLTSCAQDRCDGFAALRLLRSALRTRTAVTMGAVRHDTRPSSNQAHALQARGNNKTPSTLRAQRKALARKFAPGLLQPFSGMNVSVRLGEIAQTMLSRWPISPQSAKPNANFCYVAVIDRGYWLMLRESLCSLYGSWSSLPSTKPRSA